MEYKKVVSYRPAEYDEVGNEILPESWDDLSLVTWGVYPVSKQDSDGAWRYHEQTVAVCKDTTGKIHIVDPEFLSIIE